MPGQFINSGTNPFGKLSLINSNNSGNLSLSIAPPAFYTYQGYYNGFASTLYSADSLLGSGSNLYTDSALTTPYTLGGFISSSYNFLIFSPYSGSIGNINNAGTGISVNEDCTLNSGPTLTAYSYPTYYITLAEVYANDATLYTGPYNNGNHPFPSATTISDGTGLYSYNGATGKLTGILDSCYNVEGAYCTSLATIYSGGDCYACNNASPLNTYVWHSGSTIEIGDFLASDPGLTSGIGGNTYYSNGIYSYYTDASSIVTSKVTCGTKSSTYNINETNNCGDGTPITLYYAQNPGVPQTGLAGVTLYTDCNLTTPYTYTGPAHDYSRVYSVVGGVFTYSSACPGTAYISTLGLSNTSAAEACSNFTTSPTTILSTYGSTLDELVTYQSSIWYASNNQNVTASYISDGVNSYEITQNYNGNGYPVVTGSPTSC
jgi:hypothetical protein